MKKKTVLERFKEIEDLEVADEQGKTVKDILPYKCGQVEKSLKALEIIKEKNVDLKELKKWIYAESKNIVESAMEKYNQQVAPSEQLTEEEFNVLKEGLKYE